MGDVGNMQTVKADLPADLVAVAKLDRGDVSLETAKLIALETLSRRQGVLGPRGGALPHTRRGIHAFRR
jgi:hypothetical protein